LVPDTGAAASCTVAVTTPPATAVVAVVTGAAARLGGFMHVPVLAPLVMTQVRPCPAQHAVAPAVAEVQPVAPIAMQGGAAQRGVSFIRLPARHVAWNIAHNAHATCRQRGNSGGGTATTNPNRLGLNLTGAVVGLRGGQGHTLAGRLQGEGDRWRAVCDGGVAHAVGRLGAQAGAELQLHRVCGAAILVAAHAGLPACCNAGLALPGGRAVHAVAVAVVAGGGTLGGGVGLLRLGLWGSGERGAVHQPGPPSGGNVEGAGAIRTAALLVQAAAVLQGDGAHAAALAASSEAGLAVAIGGAVDAVAIAGHLGTCRGCVRAAGQGEQQGIQMHGNEIVLSEAGRCWHLI